MSTPVAWVSGVHGFVGRHLCSALALAGWQVIGFSRAPFPEMGHLLLPLREGAFDEAFSEKGVPSKVFHLAGGATVGRSFEDPFADYHSNVGTTAMVLDAVRRICPETPVVIASSAAVYGSRYTQPISCDAYLKPYSPYGHHKRMAEQLAVSFSENFDMRLTILRFFSLYGSGLRKQLLFDICTQLSARNETVRLGGSGKEVRDWCHVSDAVRAMMYLKSPIGGHVDTYNIGNAQGLTIREVAEIVINAWDEKRSLNFSGHSRLGDPFSLVAASDSLPPGFVPAVTAEKGFQEYVRWFKRSLHGGNE